MSLLILASDQDVHARAVSAELTKKAVPHRFFLYMDYPAKATLGYQINNNSSRLALEVNGETLDFRDFSVAWSWRPFEAKASHALDKGFRKYTEIEADKLLDSLPDLTPHMHWLPHPGRMRAAQSKAWQLRLARECGLKIPDTVIGNSPAMLAPLLSRYDALAVKAFYRAHSEFELNLPQKALQAGLTVLQKMGLYEHEGLAPGEAPDFRNISSVPTTRVSAQDLRERATQLTYCPVITQGYVEKQLELRVTVVGDQVFPCAIYSQEGPEENKVDCRHEIDQLRHERFDLPPEIAAKCVAVVKALGLEFGCMDLILTPEGEYVFLENNAGGCWLWIEELTGMPITAALADRLVHYL
ncbi:MAG: hypothetical protein AB7P76_10520 [Candidatus Melainabacteria bacterium]